MLNNLRLKEKNKTERISIRINKEEKKELIKYCKEKNINLSQYIYNLIVVDMSMFHKELTEEKE